jgi:hypothetical protein
MQWVPSALPNKSPSRSSPCDSLVSMLCPCAETTTSLPLPSEAMPPATPVATHTDPKRGHPIRASPDPRTYQTLTPLFPRRKAQPLASPLTRPSVAPNFCASSPASPDPPNSTDCPQLPAVQHTTPPPVHPTHRHNIPVSNIPGVTPVEHPRPRNASGTNSNPNAGRGTDVGKSAPASRVMMRGPLSPQPPCKMQPGRPRVTDDQEPPSSGRVIGARSPPPPPEQDDIALISPRRVIGIAAVLQEPRSVPVTNVADRALLSDWLSRARRFGTAGMCSPRIVFKMVHELRLIGMALVATKVPVVLPALRLLLDKGLADGRKATLLDALGNCMVAHPELYAAFCNDVTMTGTLEELMGAAAADNETYANELCLSQMVTAQSKLAQHCAAFWQQLELRKPRKLKLSGRSVSTIVHHAAQLTTKHGAPPPPPQLWHSLLVVAAERSPSMTPQEVANVMLGCATLEAYLPCASLPEGPERRSMLHAVGLTAARMHGQDVSNSLWALARLDIPLQGFMSGELHDVAVLMAPRMGSQDVPKALWAIARLGAPLEGVLRDQLLAAAARVARGMRAEGVAQLLWALVKLRVPLEGLLQREVLLAVGRVGAAMSGCEVFSTVLALTRLHAPLDRPILDALVAAATAAAEDMSDPEVASLLDAFTKAGVPIEGALKDAMVASTLRLAMEGWPEWVQSPVPAQPALADTVAKAL